MSWTAGCPGNAGAAALQDRATGDDEAFRTPARFRCARCASRRDRGRAASPRTAARSSPATCSSRCRAPRPTGCVSSRQALPRAPRRRRRAGAAGAAGRRRRSSRSTNARRALALAAARFYPRQPAVIAAVTGTSGKTSVAAFTRQIWAALGHEAASIGTVGVVTPKREVYGSLTTPDPVALHRTLSMNSPAKASRISRSKRPRMASTSIGSTACGSRRRASPICRAIISTIIRRVEAYLAAKLRLFEALVVDGGSCGDRCRSRARASGGRGGEAARAQAHHGRPQRRGHPAGRRRRSTVLRRR